MQTRGADRQRLAFCADAVQVCGGLVALPGKSHHNSATGMQVSVSNQFVQARPDFEALPPASFKTESDYGETDFAERRR
jgi:hypothetical protein